jgi:hypothetical protein
MDTSPARGVYPEELTLLLVRAAEAIQPDKAGLAERISIHLAPARTTVTGLPRFSVPFTGEKKLIEALTSAFFIATYMVLPGDWAAAAIRDTINTVKTNRNFFITPSLSSLLL